LRLSSVEPVRFTFNKKLLVACAAQVNDYIYLLKLNSINMEGKKYKILLCEDDTNLGMVLKNYLELNDY